jgi:hypothetical protein
MTEVSDLIAQAPRLLDNIVDAHLRDELPGESETVVSARQLMRLYLLGRLSPEEEREPAVRVVPALPPPEFAISPAPPVETASVDPDERKHHQAGHSPMPAGCGVPGTAPSGETPEEIVASAPPATLRKRREKRAPFPGKVEPEVNQKEVRPSLSETGARQYVLAQTGKGQGIDPRMVGTYLGTDNRGRIQQFISQVQDEFKQSAIRDARVAKGYKNLLDSIEDTDEEDLEDVEPPAIVIPRNGRRELPQRIKKKRTVADIENAPHWWSESVARCCANPECGRVIAPTKRGDNQKWEAISQYRVRKYCSIDCSSARFRTKGKGEGKQRANFREEEATTATGAA